MMQATKDIQFSIRSVLDKAAGGMAEPRPWARMLAKTVDRVVGLDAISDVYADINSRVGGSFCRRALESLCIGAEIRPEDLNRIPKTGPLIVAANHPLGGVDGLLLVDTIQKVRGDVKLLANSWLGAIPELAEHVIPVDVFDAKSAMNASALRQAMRWLRDAGAWRRFRPVRFRVCTCLMRRYRMGRGRDQSRRWPRRPGHRSFPCCLMRPTVGSFRAWGNCTG
jgi:hypothetical protein